MSVSCSRWIAVMELESPSLQLPRCAVQAINFVGKTLLESDDTLFLATECTIFVAGKLAPKDGTIGFSSDLWPEANVYFPTPSTKSRWRRSIFQYKFIEFPLGVHGVSAPDALRPFVSAP
jgi:hypothetical protein